MLATCMGRMLGFGGEEGMVDEVLGDKREEEEWLRRLEMTRREEGAAEKGMDTAAKEGGVKGRRSEEEDVEYKGRLRYG